MLSHLELACCQPCFSCNTVAIRILEVLVHSGLRYRCNEGERSQSVLRRWSIYQAALWKSHRIHLSLLPWECPVREAYSAGLVAACAWASSASPDCLEYAHM